MSLFLAFLVCSFSIFGLVIFTIRPTADQKAMVRRVASIKVSQATLSSTNEDVSQYLKTLPRGNFGWLEDVVNGSWIQRYLQTLIIQADQETTIGDILIRAGGSSLAGLIIVYLFTANLIFAGLAMLITGYVPVGLLVLRKAKRIGSFNKALPDCIDMMARSLRAGHSLNAAISIVADQAEEPAKTEFNEVFKKQNYGLPMREALMQLLDRVPSQDLRVLITGILVQKDTGGNLAEILDRILFVIRERVRIHGEIKTHTAQGRLTGWILCALPIVMLALINWINPGYSNVLFHDSTGQKLLYAGVALLAIGTFVINKIISGIEI